MRYAVRHVTRYAYSTPVDLGYHLLRLTPADGPRQRLIDHALTVTPEPDRIGIFRDHFGNEVRHIAIERPHEGFAAQLDATVEVLGRGGEVLPEGPGWEGVRDALHADGFAAEPEVAEFIFASPRAALEESARRYAAASFPARRPIVEGLRELTRRIRADFAYEPGTTNISTPVSAVMERRRGVCQDFAHLMIAGLRGLGLPARYVSGYLRTYRREEDKALRGADASHAWVSAWCGPAIGWIELDPTNDLVVDREHIVLAYGRDFSDVSPLSGVILGGGEHGLDVEVTVTPLDAGATVAGQKAATV